MNLRKRGKNSKKKKDLSGRKACIRPEWNQIIEECTHLLVISLCPQERRACKSTTMSSRQ